MLKHLLAKNHRWTNKDWNWGIFKIYRFASYSRSLGITLETAQFDNLNTLKPEYNTLRFHLFSFALVIYLPALLRTLKTVRRVGFLTQEEQERRQAAGTDTYTQQHTRKIGLLYLLPNKRLAVYYGSQRASAEKLKFFRNPITNITQLKEDVYGPTGEHITEIPKDRLVEKLVPVKKRGLLRFTDHDGATVYGAFYERRTTYTQGIGFFSFLKHVWPDTVKRALKVDFFTPVGYEKHSYKGGDLSLLVPLKDDYSGSLIGAVMAEITEKYLSTPEILSVLPEGIEAPKWWND